MITRKTQFYKTVRTIGGLFYEDYTSQVDEIDASIMPNNKSAFAFRFHKVDVQETVVDGETFIKRSDPYDYTGWYFIGGTSYTLDTLPNTDEYRILRDNMKWNNWEYVIKHRFNGFTNFDPNTDVILTSQDTQP